MGFQGTTLFTENPLTDPFHRKTGSSGRIAAQNQPCKAKQDHQNDSTQDLQVRDSSCRLLLRTSPPKKNAAGCGFLPSAAVPSAGRRCRFCPPAADARAVVAGREPAVRAVLPPAVLAGERQNTLRAAVIAAGHSTCLADSHLILQPESMIRWRIWKRMLSGSSISGRRRS